HDVHDRADDHARHAPVRNLAGRLDRGHAGPQVDRPVRAHHRGHRGRLRDPDSAVSDGDGERPAAPTEPQPADVSGGWAPPAALWTRRGLPAKLAIEVAKAVAANPDEAVRVHAREELGVDPEEAPSPWLAAISSFISFSVGALLPLLPYLLGASHLLLSLAAG